MFEYRLTSKGLDLYPVILSIWRFHRRWGLDPASLPEQLIHSDCGQPFLPELVCSTCGEAPTPEEIIVHSRTTEFNQQERSPVRRTRIANKLESMGDTHLATVVLGDAWNMLLLDAATKGVSQFHDLQHQLGISSNILAARLKLMVQLGLLEQATDEKDKRVRKYVLSDKGRETYPIILTLTAWADRWLAGNDGPSEVLVHAPCQSYATFRLRCSVCSQNLHVSNVRTSALHGHPV